MLHCLRSDLNVQRITYNVYRALHLTFPGQQDATHIYTHRVNSSWTTAAVACDCWPVPPSPHPQLLQQSC